MANIKDMVSPIVRISYFCTIAPFVIVRNRKEYISVGSHPFYLIRIIGLTVILEAMIIRESQQFADIVAQQVNGVIITTVRFGIFYAMLLGFPLYSFVTFLNSSKIADFMNNIKQIGSEMEEIGLRMNFKSKYRMHVFQIGCKLFEMFLGTVCFIHFVSDGTILNVVFLAFFSIPFMLTYMILIQWTSFVNLLTMHFASLNRFLKTLKYRQCFIVEDFPKVKRKPLIEVIEECGTIYDQLCDESKRLNEAYAWQILYLIPHYFLITLSSIYEVLVSFKNDTPFSEQKLINGLLGALYLLEFVVPCALCKEEAGRFSDILNKVDLKLQKSQEMEDVVKTISNCALYNVSNISMCFSLRRSLYKHTIKK